MLLHVVDIVCYQLSHKDHNCPTILSVLSLVYVIGINTITHAMLRTNKMLIAHPQNWYTLSDTLPVKAEI